MRRLNRPFMGMALLFVLVFAFAGIVDAVDIVLEPANVQREVGGKVRLHIYADNAVGLISTGVKISFDPSVLKVLSASKYVDVEQGWVMDADGDSATTDDQYTTPPVEIDNTNGMVTMIGGRLTGSSTQGLSGKVLLGWIVFEAIALGNSDLNVDLAKYHPGHPANTFDNFVKLNGNVDEPVNVPEDLGMICAVKNACEGDIKKDGYVDRIDSLFFKRAFNTSFGDASYNPACDLNGDGYVDRIDSLFFKRDFNRNDCPACQ